MQGVNDQKTEGFGDHTFATAVEMAKVALTSIVTSCSGLIIGLFAFAGQRATMTDRAEVHLIWAVGLAACALILSIVGAMFGYLSELAYHNSDSNMPWWTIAFGTSVAAIFALALALLQGGMMLLAG